MKDIISITYEIHIVLVKTIYPLNIGSVSRAMSNMGAKQLHLIQPQCSLTYEAQQMAANGQEGLTHRMEYSTWDEFFQKNPDGLRIALTARDGRARKLNDLKQGLQSLTELTSVRRANLNKLYLIFGPEDCGLSGAEIDQAHFACSIPTYGPNWSLNLAQAVLLSLFIVRDQWGGERTQLDGQRTQKQDPGLIEETSLHDDQTLTQKPFTLTTTSQAKNVLPETILYEWIQTLGFDLSKRRINAFTVMKRILLHNVPTSKELRIFEVVLQQTIRKLKEHRDNERNK